MEPYRLSEKQFASFCCKVIKHSLIDYHREESRKAKRNVFTVPIDNIDISEIASDGGIGISRKVFINALRQNVLIYNETLADALTILPQTLRDIVLMYYFMDLTDKDISTYFGVSKQAIWDRRQRALKKLSIMMLLGGQNET